MTARTLLALATVLLLVPGKALALKDQVQVSLKNQETAGFLVTTDQRKDGAIQFTITRDLSKARSYGPDSNLQVRRSSTLEVYGDSGLIVKCQLDAVKKKKTLIYRFVIARDHIAQSRLTVAEIDDYKDNEGREHLLGGGTFYRFRLAEFSEK